MNRTQACLAFVMLIVVAIWPATAQQSANFSMDRISVTAVANTASSTNFETTVVVGQNSPSGASSFCNTGFINSTGFWSVLGDLPVPIQLRVDKNTDPTAVDLMWTGADDTFQLFRSTSPVNVTDPTNLQLETPLCDASDTDASGSNILFYNVIPRR